MKPLPAHLLEEVYAGCLVLDQDNTGLEHLRLIVHGTLKLGIFEPAAKDANQVGVLAGDSPGRTNAIVAELGRLVGGIPTLHNTFKIGHLVGHVSPEPFELYQTATERRR